MGCGSCKALVSEIVEWACAGQMEEDPSVHYYVPGIPLTKPELVDVIREQRQRLPLAVDHHGIDVHQQTIQVYHVGHPDIRAALVSAMHGDDPLGDGIGGELVYG